MPYVLVGTNLEQDPAIVERYERVLQTHGFHVDVTQPMSQVPAAVEMVARVGGKMDAVVLAHHGAISSSSTDLFDIARSIRRIGDTVAFLSAVRARTLPIVALTDLFAYRRID